MHFVLDRDRHAVERSERLAGAVAGARGERGDGRAIAIQRDEGAERRWAELLGIVLGVDALEDLARGDVSGRIGGSERARRHPAGERCGRPEPGVVPHPWLSAGDWPGLVPQRLQAGRRQVEQPLHLVLVEGDRTHRGRADAGLRCFQRELEGAALEAGSHGGLGVWGGRTMPRPPGPGNPGELPRVACPVDWSTAGDSPAPSSTGGASRPRTDRTRSALNRYQSQPRSASAALVRLALAAIVAALAGGCTTFFETDLGDARAVDDGVNACGGSASLRYDGADASVGDRCGPCGGGFLVCNGTDSLRCLGAAEENACGGCAPLVAEPDDPCGFCGDGYFTCDGNNDVVCTHASFPNACGGCSELPGAPGFPCRADDGEGTWVCTSPTSVACQSGDRNACGGGQALQHQGVITAPGQPCAGDCVDGVLVCDGENALDCRGAEDANACGGCSVLPGDPGAACGPCGTGTWTCTVDGEMECDTEAPNVCGGCETFAAAALPGSSCAGGTVICNTPDTSICASLGADTNACGGIGQLDASPGDPCGTCDSGLWTCSDVARVSCDGDRGEDARNACGGCAQLDGEPGARCGACGSGTWECDGEDAVVCAGDEGEGAPNECGGCGRLWGEVGAACADCYSFDCLAEGERLQCVFDSVEDAAADECGPPPTCETQGCEILNRECLTDDEGRPYCGGCIEGFFSFGGECVGAQCAGDGDCPVPPAGQWGECEPDIPPCSYDGTRTRVGRTAICIDGTCQLRTDPIVEDCRFDTDGLVVSDAVASECVAAAAGEECSTRGTQSVTQTVCQDDWCKPKTPRAAGSFRPEGGPATTKYVRRAADPYRFRSAG